MIAHKAALIASLALATAAGATAPGGTTIATAHSSYSADLHSFTDPTGITRSGTGFGAEVITIVDSQSITHAEYSPTLYSSAYYDNGSGSGHGSATNNLLYAYRVKAANAGAAASLAAYLAANSGVGLTAQGRIVLEEGSSSYGTASGSADFGAGTFTVQCSHYYGHSGGCGTTNFTASAHLTAGALNEFDGLALLSTSASLSEGGSSLCFGGLGGPGGGGSHCLNGRNYEYAYVDPTFTLASGFTSQPGYNAADYTLQFSPTTVPEPASWALLIVGFGLTGAALRRRAIVRA